VSTSRRRALASIPVWIALAAMVGPLLVSVVPVTNPGVQDCGAPASFLLGGHVDTYPDANGQVRRPNGKVETLTKAEQARAFDHQCSARIAARMGPAAGVFAFGTLLGVVTLLVSMVCWWRAAPRRGDPPPAPATA